VAIVGWLNRGSLKWLLTVVKKGRFCVVTTVVKIGILGWLLGRLKRGSFGWLFIW